MKEERQGGMRRRKVKVCCREEGTRKRFVDEKGNFV